MPEKPAASTLRARVATLSHVVARVMTSNSMVVSSVVVAALPRREQVGQVCGGRTEADMSQETSARRDVLRQMAAAGATGLTAGTLGQPAARAAGAAAYDPAAHFDVASARSSFGATAPAGC